MVRHRIVRPVILLAMAVGLLSYPSAYSYAAENNEVTEATATDASIPEEVEPIYYSGDSTNSEYDLIKTTIDGVEGWYKFTDGSFDPLYTGFAQNENGWWYVKDGVLVKNKTGIVKGTIAGATKNYYVKNGNAKLSFTGFAKVCSDWRYIVKGVPYNKTCTVNGTINGVKDWYYVKSGKVDLIYKGFAKVGSSWMYFTNGTINKKKTGSVSATIDGVKTWYYVKSGKLDSRFTLIAKVGSTQMYFCKGKLDKTFSGKCIYNNKTYTIKKGKVTNLTNNIQDGCTVEYHMGSDGRIHGYYVHNWVWKTHTVHHDEVYHIEYEYSEPYDETIFTTKIRCHNCQGLYENVDDLFARNPCFAISGSINWAEEYVVDHYEHHDAEIIGEHKVIDKEAYDEVVKDYQYCTKCGIRK